MAIHHIGWMAFLPRETDLRRYFSIGRYNDIHFKFMMRKKELLSEIFEEESVMPKGVPKRVNTILRRKQIVAALRKIIIKYGSENLTVQKLAEEIGVSGGAIYRHFKSKREILLFLVNDIKENLIGDIERAYPIKNPLELLERISRNLLSSIEQRKGVSFLVIAEIISLGDKGLNGEISEVLNRFLGEIKKLILEGIKAGEIRKDVDVDMAATTFFGMLQGLATIWALGGFPPKLENRNASMWKFFLEAIKKEEDKTPAREIAIRLPFSAGVRPSGLK